MIRTLLYVSLSAAFILQAGPTSITSDGHSIFYGPPQEKAPKPPVAVIPQGKSKTEWPEITGAEIYGTFENLGNFRIGNDFVGTVTVESHTGRIERLTAAEYAGLQKLRQAVADEETRIAKAHGVEWKERAVNDCKENICMGLRMESYPAESYEYRGQFLLINVPEGKAK